MRIPQFALAFGLLIALSGFVATNSASANDCYRPRVDCGYKTVNVIVEKEIAYRRGSRMAGQQMQKLEGQI